MEEEEDKMIEEKDIITLSDGKDYSVVKILELSDKKIFFLADISDINIQKFMFLKSDDKLVEIDDENLISELRELVRNDITDFSGLLDNIIMQIDNLLEENN